MFRRINEVIQMQNNSKAWAHEYENLMKQKIERLRSVPPESAADLRAEWKALVTEIRGALAEDPASATAQEFGSRWTQLLARLMGQPISPGAVAHHHSDQEWDPRMASFVEKPVWDFMTRVLAVRR
jgi:hypothetical protein